MFRRQRRRKSRDDQYWRSRLLMPNLYIFFSSIFFFRINTKLLSLRRWWLIPNKEINQIISRGEWSRQRKTRTVYKMNLYVFEHSDTVLYMQYYDLCLILCVRWSIHNTILYIHTQIHGRYDLLFVDEEYFGQFGNAENNIIVEKWRDNNVYTILSLTYTRTPVDLQAKAAAAAAEAMSGSEAREKWN